MISNLVSICQIPGMGLLQSPKLPDTTLHIDTDAGDKRDQFGAEGLLFTPLEAMKRWGIRYQGPMRRVPESSVSKPAGFHASTYADSAGESCRWT